MRGLVNPWAVRRSTWSRLLVPSILPLEGRPVWCQLRISSDHAMNVSGVVVLGQLAGLVEVAEPPEGFEGDSRRRCRGRGAPGGPASRL